MITNTDDLPTEVKNSFSPDDMKSWMSFYNEHLSEGLTPDEAKEMAWFDCRYLDSSRYVCANVSTEVVDREGDLAIVKEYVRAGQELVKHGGILTKNHSNKVIGTVWKVAEGEDSETGKPCVLAYMNYFRGTMLYDSSWMEFKDGRTEFSIGSYTQKPERECDFRGCYFKLIPEMWFELSNVDRGINPITYPVDVHENAKGDIPMGKIVEFHNEECPVKKKYLAFKARMLDYGHEVNYDEHFLLIHRPMKEDELIYVYDEYPDIRQFEVMMGESDDDVYTLLLPKLTVNDSNIDTDVDSSVVADAEISEATKGNCPAGQHEHAGIWGCHDILRRHHQDEKTTPTDALDLTDENIDISAIKSTPTDTLKNIVTKIASILSRYSDDAVQQFLSSTQGKEFVLAFLELKKRKMNGEKNMAEKEAGCSAKAEVPEEEIKAETPEEPVEADKAMTEPKEPTEEAEKGTIPDIQSSIANISSTLASITALVDQMNIRIMKLEDSDLKKEGDGGMSISDAIMSETNDVGGDGAPAIPAPEAEKEDAGEDKSGDVPPQFEKTDDDESDDDSEKEDVEVKVEEDSKEESDDKDESDGDDESKDDDSEKEESEDKESKDESEEDSKEDSKEESKEEDKEDSKEEEDKEKKKGTEDEVPASEVAVDAPADAGAESVDVAEPPVEKADVVPEVAEEVAVAPEPQPVVDYDVPIPNGGQAVDFRAMLLQRQAELREKGVELYIAGEGAQRSLATVPIEIIRGTNVTLVHPSTAIKGFDAETGVKGASIFDMIDKMGTMNSNDFMKTMIGE